MRVCNTKMTCAHLHTPQHRASKVVGVKAWEDEEARHAAAVVQWRRDVRKYERECLKVLLSPHMRTYIHAYIHTYIHAYIHTCMQTYTCVHTYMHTYMHVCIFGYACALRYECVTSRYYAIRVCCWSKGSAVRESAPAGCDNARPRMGPQVALHLRTHALLILHRITNTNIPARTAAAP